MNRPEFKVGDLIESGCIMHAARACMCLGRGPWRITSIEGSFGEDRHLSCEHLYKRDRDGQPFGMGTWESCASHSLPEEVERAKDEEIRWRENRAQASKWRRGYVPATFPHVSEEMSLETFKARCEAMRTERASKAWGIEIELPPRIDESTEDEAMAQRLTPAEKERRLREERRRRALAASGGPRPRVDDT